MPASQAASRTPGTAGISGSREGANGDSFAAALAMPSLLESYCFGRTPARSFSMALLISGSMYSIRAFPLKSPAICCAFLWIMSATTRSLTASNGGVGALAAVVDADDVPAELALEGLADLALLQLEGGLLELRHHLPAREEAELAALVLRARVLGMLLGQLRKVGPVRQLLEQIARLVLALDQDVAGADLLLGLRRPNWPS